jgi:hypothetical protein
MADILYIINYDDVQGLSTSQSIVGIGTSRDRVRFVTTTNPQKYQIALKRDLEKNAYNWPLQGVVDPYPVPQASADPEWFALESPGTTDSFHYICGYLENGKFERYKVRKVSTGGGTGTETAPVHSLPWPT